MPVAWSLQRANAGLLQSFSDWGIRSAVRVSINQGIGTLTLGFGATDIFTASPFDPDEQLDIRRDGLTWFRGRLTSEKRGAYGSSEGLSIVLSDPWWYLERTIYTQRAPFVDSPTANPVPADPAGLQLSDFTLVTKETSNIVVSTDQQGSTVDSKAQVIDALNYAIAKGAPIGIGTIDAGIAIPRDELRDVTCAEIIQKSLRWTPEMTVWWDYSVTPPQINIRTRANRAVSNIDIADEGVAEVELNERRDLAVSGVTLNYLRTHQRDNFSFQTLEIDTAGPTPDGIGALILTQDLYGSFLHTNLNNLGQVVGTNVVLEEPTPIGVAQRLFDNFGLIPWQGRINLVDDDLSDTVWLRQTVAVLNGNPAWANAVMDIQQASEDIFGGRVELTIGPPTQLSGADLIGLVRQARTDPPPAGTNTGGTPTSNPFPPTSPDPGLQFGGPKPDVILYFNSTNSPNIFDQYVPGTWDDVTVYDSPGAPSPGFEQASDMIPGEVVDVHGVKVGRADRYLGDPNDHGHLATPPAAVHHVIYLSDPNWRTSGG